MSITYQTVIIDENDTELKEKYANHNVNYMKDVGVDLFMPKKIEVPGKAKSFKVGTGIKCTGVRNNQRSSYEIWPRSSMGGKTPLRLSNSIGLVDPDYTGELLLLLDNMSEEEYEINRMDRLVQLVGPCHEQPNVKIVEELEITERGEKGVGSSGK